MIRHANSLLLSLFLHAILLFALLYTTKLFYSYAEKKANLIPIKLCSVLPANQNSACHCDAPLKKEPVVKKRVEVKKIEKVDAIQPVKPVKKVVEVVQKNKLEESSKKEKTPKQDKTFETKTIAKVVAEPSPAQESKEAREQRLESEYLDEHMQAIIRLLQENLYYPRRARENGITGKRVVKFILNRDGVVEFSEVLSSQRDILSRAAIKTLENLSGRFPKPKEKLVVRLPINYNLVKE